MNYPLNNLLDLLERHHDPDTCRLLYEILRLRSQNTPTSRAQLKLVLLHAATALHNDTLLHDHKTLNAEYQSLEDEITLDFMGQFLPDPQEKAA